MKRQSTIKRLKNKQTSRKDNMTKKKKEKYKLPENYFCLNDMTPSSEIEEVIIQECESAGLEITEDEELASERCYDRAFEVVNPYKDKLKKVLEICKTNMKVDWVSADMEVCEEFGEIVKIIEEK